jgi:dihydroxyacetone kinase
MKKFINNVEDILTESLNGFALSLIKQLAAANSCTARKSSFSFLTTQSFPGSSGS